MTKAHRLETFRLRPLFPTSRQAPHRAGSGATIAGLVVASLVLGGILGGCASRTAEVQAIQSGAEAGDEDLSLARFTDIPIPSGTRMDVTRSLILGESSSWIGRLVFRTGTAPQPLFEFYAREMPRFGWTEVTRARSDVSILSYTQANRAATIQIARTSLGGSEVNVTMSPRAGAHGILPAPPTVFKDLAAR